MKKYSILTIIIVFILQSGCSIKNNFLENKKPQLLHCGFTILCQ